VGSHFLWKMVRRIVGVLVDVGRETMGETEVKGLLTRKSRAAAAITAPPSGLFLERVFYEDDTTEYPIVPLFGVTRA